MNHTTVHALSRWLIIHTDLLIILSVIQWTKLAEKEICLFLGLSALTEAYFRPCEENVGRTELHCVQPVLRTLARRMRAVVWRQAWRGDGGD